MYHLFVRWKEKAPFSTGATGILCMPYPIHWPKTKIMIASSMLQMCWITYCTNKQKVSSRGTKDILRHHLRCPWITMLHQSIQYFYLSWQSKRQRQHRSLSHDERTVYALCVLLFPQCYVPLHLPLTDLILCHGGTTELVTVLNRFGAVASADTHSRFLQDLSADRKAILPKMHSTLFL